MWFDKIWKFISEPLAGSEVLNVGRGLGTLDSEGQRVLQVFFIFIILYWKETCIYAYSSRNLFY